MSTHKKKDRKRKEAAFLFCKVFLRVAEGKEKTFLTAQDGQCCELCPHE